MSAEGEQNRHYFGEIHSENPMKLKFQNRKPCSATRENESIELVCDLLCLTLLQAACLQ
jgi:hypothetical protein